MCTCTAWCTGSRHGQPLFLLKRTTSTFEAKMSFSCQRCAFCCSVWRKVIRHTFEAHSSEPNFNFTCSVKGCTKTCDKFSTMLSHLSRSHRGVNFDDPSEHNLVGPLRQCDGYRGPNQQQHLTEYEGRPGSQDDSVSACEWQSALMDIEPTPTERLRKSAAQFLITLKEKYQITQTALDFAVAQVEQMVCYSIEDAQSRVQLALQQCSADIDIQLGED